MQKKDGPKFNLRKAGEGSTVDPKWKKATIYKKENEEQSEEEEEESVSLNLKGSLGVNGVSFGWLPIAALHALMYTAQTHDFFCSGCLPPAVQQAEETGHQLHFR